MKISDFISILGNFVRDVKFSFSYRILSKALLDLHIAHVQLGDLVFYRQMCPFHYLVPKNEGKITNKLQVKYKSDAIPGSLQMGYQFRKSL